MASKDVLDQIRDLQSFIDEFAADAGTVSPISLQEKTEVAEPIVVEHTYQKPNEKTELEPEKALEKPNEKSENLCDTEQEMLENEADEKNVNTSVENSAEKTLVESVPPAQQQQPEPLSIMSYDLNISDDFSSLLSHFKDLKVSPVGIKMTQRIESVQEEKVQEVDENTNSHQRLVKPIQTASSKVLSPVVPKMRSSNKVLSPISPKVRSSNKILSPTSPRARSNRILASPGNTRSIISPTTPKLSNNSTRFNNNSFVMTESSTRSRRTSVSSKRSQRSSKSARSARKLLNEKKLQQQKQEQQNKQSSASQTYVERSYDEMMRITDIYERLVFYEKTLDLCLKAESPITKWTKENQAKGKPQPMLEGYVPPARSFSPEVPISENSFGNVSSTFSGSISMLLKKAGSQNPNKRNSILENRSFLLPSSSYTPQTPSNYRHGGGGSGLFGRSISRLNLSRSTQIPRYDNQIKTPAATRLTPLYQNSNRVANISSPMKKRSTLNIVNNSLSPLRMDLTQIDDANKKISPNTPKSSASTPNSFGSGTTTINSQGEFTSQNSALNYMINILPQIDTSILQNALNEAKGDPMLAISIAVTNNKLSNHHAKPITQKKTAKYYKKVK